MIERFKTKNFKSLQELDLLLGPVNVFVGPNMSGKSNVIDAIRFVREVAFPESGTQGVSYALAQRGGVNEALWKGGDEKLLALGLEGSDETDSNTTYKYMLEVVAGPGGFANLQGESLKALTPQGEIDLIARQQSQVQLQNIDRQVAGGIGQLGASVLQYASPGWDGFKFVRWIERWRFYHFLPPQMKEPSSMSFGEVLTEEGQNFSAWLMWLQTRAPEAFGRINEALRDIFSDVTQIKSHPTSEGKVHLEVIERHLKRPTTVWQTSDGFLAVAAILSLIYAPPELSPALLCIEEPENHLHPRILETIVSLLRQVRQEAIDSKNPVSQIILTTQSPYLVDQFSLDEITWFEKKQGATRAYRPADKQHLKDLVENKELGLGNLMYTGALGNEE
jgi:predicted ATPase